MKAAAKSLIPFRPKPARRSRYELAFLPAALEIVDTPPSPIGRATMITIVTLFSLALLWACLASVDIIATAAGKIVPSGRSKVIQPFETGVVRAIHVQDGQAVKAGDLLIELDPTINDADQARLRSDLYAAQLDVARLHAALTTEGDPLAAFKPPAGANPAMVTTERQLLVDQLNEETAKLAALDRQKTGKEAERATTAATIAKIQSTMPMLEQRVQVRKYLFEQGLGSKLLYLQEAQDLVANQKELQVQKSRYQEAEAGVAALVEQRAQAAAEYRHALSDELAKDEAKAAGLGQDFLKAQERTKLQRLTAPVDGVVQQLAIHTVGGVVTPAQQLMVVVPVDSHLEIEAMVSNRDIGFIHDGQTADIKVNTFSYTRYGLLHGEVESVSADSIVPASRGDESGDASAASDASDSGDGSPKDPAYAARVSLDQGQMQIDDRLVKLTPGMAVTVEIKTGSRRIIGYLLSPLLRYGHESIRER